MNYWKRIKNRVLRILLGSDKINPFWYGKIKLALSFSRKIKVGFGPITTGEEDLAERKWRIDPIIDLINQHSHKYRAAFFFSPDQMERFDIILIVKKLNPFYFGAIEKLASKKIIYDIVDNPNDEERFRFYFRQFPSFLKRVDCFILSSPLHKFLMHQLKKPFFLIEHPILNPLRKKKREERDEIRILAQGYYQNLRNLQFLETLLPQISKEIGKTVRLYYHSEHIDTDSEHVRYLRWSVENAFTTMEWADIAVTIKDLHKLHQYTKPSTKVIAYMAAGLPVICKPTAADRLIIQDRINGYFAYREEDWIRWIKLLASSSRRRSEVGRAAQNEVYKKYSQDKILKKYLALLDYVHV